MKTILSIFFIVGCIGTWYYIKKDKNTSKRNISLGIVLLSLILISMFPPTPENTKALSKSNSPNDLQKSTNKGNSEQTETSISSSSNSETSSVTSKQEKNFKKEISLSDKGDFQFSGLANIKPTKVEIKKKKLTFYFDWRNDDGSQQKRTFNGSGVTVIAYQNGKELEQSSDTYSGSNQYIEKNTTLEINYEYTLYDDTPVTIKLLPLEGKPQEFTFNIVD